MESPPQETLNQWLWGRWRASLQWLRLTGLSSDVVGVITHYAIALLASRRVLLNNANYPNKYTLKHFGHVNCESSPRSVGATVSFACGYTDLLELIHRGPGLRQFGGQGTKIFTLQDYRAGEKRGIVIYTDAPWTGRKATKNALVEWLETTSHDPNGTLYLLSYIPM